MSTTQRLWFWGVTSLVVVVSSGFISSPIMQLLSLGCGVMFGVAFYRWKAKP